MSSHGKENSAHWQGKFRSQEKNITFYSIRNKQSLFWLILLKLVLYLAFTINFFSIFHNWHCTLRPKFASKVNKEGENRKIITKENIYNDIGTQIIYDCSFLGAVSLQIKASCLKVNGIVSRFSTHFLFKKTLPHCLKSYFFWLAG